MIVSTFYGKSLAVQAIMADVVQKISWSTFVCVGLAVGSAASKMRSRMMGLAGLVAAPISFYLARIFHKSAVQALAVAGPAASMPSAAVLAGIKAAQYAVLGLVIGKLDHSDEAGFGSYALTGLFCGLVFGGLIIYLSVTQSPATVPIVSIITRSVNELVFPVGCSLVLYSARRLSAE